jgi:S1/P1 Nuclease
MRNRTLPYIVLALSFVALFPIRTAAWGPKGHQIIARVAADRLSSKARDSVLKLLQGESLEAVSTWAEQITQQRPDTRNWDHVDIPVRYNDYQRARDCGKGVCIIEAIEQQRRVLENPKYSDSERAEALKWLVHLIGDLHQPFHVATNDNPPDAAANRVRVTFLNGRPTNLHAVWDNDIINTALREARQGVAEYASQLGRKAGGKGGYVSPRGTVTQWAVESHALAEKAYILSGKDWMLNNGKVYNLDDAYYKKSKDVVDNQLLLAGVRLAGVLNEIFR